jgi:hypothetical protein
MYRIKELKLSIKKLAKKFVSILHSKCECGEQGTIVKHTCPAEEELHNYCSPFCYCCKKCEDQCRAEV